MSIDIEEPINHFLMISESKDKWSAIFTSKLIFNKLTTEHALKLLLNQKIKYFTERKTLLNIFLDDIILEEMELHPKIYTLLKYHAYEYGIIIININEDTNLDDIFTTEIKNEIEKLNKRLMN
jgi:hypothetical protein